MRHANLPRHFAALLALLVFLPACGGGSGTLDPGGSRGALGRSGKADTGFDYALRINEVMATPSDARRGEYVEIYNDSPTPVSLEGLLIDDGDNEDTIRHLSGSLQIAAFDLGLIVDPDMRTRFPDDVAIYTVSGRAIGNGLSSSDPITLRTRAGLVLDRVDPRPTPKGYARERKAPLLDDVAGSWRQRKMGSPGRRNLYAPSARLRLHLTHGTGELDEAESIDALVTFIDATETRLDCAIYQMNQPQVMHALLQAHQRGVAVRIVTDSTFFDRPDYHAGYEPLLAAGIAIVPDERSSEQHNKFLVADERFVWIGSYNPTSNPSADAAIEMESRSLAQELILEVDEMMSGTFGVSRAPTEVAEHVVDDIPFRLLASPTDGVRDQLIARLARAKKSIHFLAFGLTEDRIGDALLERASAGVQVRGAIDWLHASRKGSEWNRLVDAGLDVRRSPHSMLMHQKLIVIDGGTPDAVVILGSYNFTARAEARNDETMLIIQSPRLAAMTEAAVAAVLGISAPVGAKAPAPLFITEVAQGTTAWVEIENSGPEPVSLEGFDLGDLESHTRLQGSLAPFERRAILFKGVLGGSSPLFLSDPAGHVVDAVASDLVIRSPGKTLTRVGPVSWALSAPTPGL